MKGMKRGFFGKLGFGDEKLICFFVKELGMSAIMKLDPSGCNLDEVV